MKRDWEVVRKILMALEEHDSDVAIKSLPDVDQVAWAYHIKILGEGKYIIGYVGLANSPSANFASALRLTWQGHELLERIRSDTTWARMKKTAKDKGMSLTIDVIKALAIEFAKQAMLPR
jgi:FPC/CPF motif-containing protein YcgG